MECVMDHIVLNVEDDEKMLNQTIQKAADVA